MSEKKEKEPGLFTYAIGVAVLVPILAYFAWATQKIWTWHLADRFGPLSLRQAIGIHLIAGILRANASHKEQRTGQEHLAAFARWMTVPLIAIGFSWLARQFVP